MRECPKCGKDALKVTHSYRANAHYSASSIKCKSCYRIFNEVKIMLEDESLSAYHLVNKIKRGEIKLEIMQRQVSSN